jgi:hypothetical protein
MNINDQVKVKLTFDGELIFKRENSYAFKWNYNSTTKELKTELWDLMNTFGKSLTMGSTQYFVNNEIEVL